MIDCYKKLWAAVLDQAVGDATFENEARAWFQSTREGVGSFLWVCDTLNLDPDSIKRKLNNRWNSPHSCCEEDLIEMSL